MSALFGHKKGAFTGAATDRAGLLKSADGGMLFLDEIGELGLDEQAMILRAVEEKRFLPVGSDREVASDFQLIAGTNSDLGEAISKGSFRDDLFARLNLWTFALPGLAERREDIDPNIDYELERFADREGQRATFNRQARERYLAFALSGAAQWPGNFRDLAASITRMATLSLSGRIDEETVELEIGRLGQLWRRPTHTNDDALANVLSETELAAIDRFDRVQLADVLSVCRSSRTLSEAGRTLFSASLQRRASSNDADRLRKYLLRFGIDWARASQR
jgi:transcriptional regulatory protein RtcR